MPEIVILGAGIAGISAAYHAETLFGKKTVVYEASGRAGGLIDHFVVDGFRFDNAIHLSFAKDPYVRSIFDRTPYIVHTPKPYNYENGLWLKHPVQNNLYPLNPNDKVEAIQSFLNRPRFEDVTRYDQWLLTQFGEYIAERYPIRYTKKYWTVDAERLSTDWIGNRLYQPGLEEILFGAFSEDTPVTYYAQEMRYPERGGYRSFVEPMLERSDIRTGKRAVRIHPVHRYVEFESGEQTHYDELISTIPLPALIPMIQDAPRDIIELASTLWATSVALVSVGFHKPKVLDHLWFYIYDEPILASRVYSPSLKSPDNAPAGCSSLQFEYYFSRYKPLPMSGDLLVEHTIDSLEKMRLAARDEIVTSDFRVLPYGNVVFDHGMTERRNRITEYLRGIGITPAGRFGEWDYFWSDQSLLSGRKAVESLMEKQK